jgi:AraC-like DNA-binding protein
MEVRCLGVNPFSLMKRKFDPNIQWEALVANATYRPKELARDCGVSLRTLQRHFRKNYNLTISNWVRSIRLNAAYSRLIAGEAVKQVAFALGYKQLSHFSRDFKAFYGVSPKFLMTGYGRDARVPSAAKIRRAAPIQVFSPLD